MSDQFVTYEVDQLLVGETLPGPIYLYLDFRFIVLRGAGDAVDRAAFDRLLMRKMRHVFVLKKDVDAFQAWFEKRPSEPIPQTEADVAIVEVRKEAQRQMMDIFSQKNPNKTIEQTLSTSKRIVGEIMKTSYAVRPLTQLQSFSRSSVDHSVNVSILSVYLAIQMGYTHAVILQHVGAGALLHDIGKSFVPIDDKDTEEQISLKMQAHSEMGHSFFDKNDTVPNEVKLIIAQHHESFDGTGFPKKLRGNAIYDLAKIVSIANVFDELVSDASGALVDRQRSAVQIIEKKMNTKFDPVKLEKALKILKMGL